MVWQSAVMHWEKGQRKKKEPARLERESQKTPGETKGQVWKQIPDWR